MGVDALMSITTSQPLNPDLLRDVSWKLCASFGPEWFFVEPGHRAIRDADPCLGWTYSPPAAQPHAYVVEIWSRYAPLDYSGRQTTLDGYAEIAWWLEREIPGCKVWYGDDSSCILVPFGRRERAKIYHHMARLGHHIRNIPATDGFCFCTFCNHNLEILYNRKEYRLERCLGCTGAVLFKNGEAFSSAHALAVKNNNEPCGFEIPRAFPKVLHELLCYCNFEADMIIH